MASNALNVVLVHGGYVDGSGWQRGRGAMSFRRDSDASVARHHSGYAFSPYMTTSAGVGFAVGPKACWNTSTMEPPA